MRAIIFTALLLSACATGPGYKQSAMVDDRAQLVIYRPTNYIGAIKFPVVSINGSEACRLPPRSYFVADVRPGEKTITAELHGKSSVTVDAVGRKYIRIGADRVEAFTAGIGANIQGVEGPFMMGEVVEQYAVEELRGGKRVCE